MKTAEDILLDYMGGKKPITEQDKKFYRVSVNDCLKLMQQAQNNALQEAAENNLKQFRECEAQAQKEEIHLNVVKMNGISRGYYYAAKQTLSLQIKDQ